MSDSSSDAETIAALRRQLFELKDDVVMPLDTWQEIWPWIDNMWVERNASRAKDRQQFNCRVWRNDSDKRKGAGQRNRQRRDVAPCGMKMYVARRGSGVIVSRCQGRATDVKHHNHKMHLLDQVKTPSALMKLAAHVMSTGKTPSETAKELRALPVVQVLEREIKRDAGTAEEDGGLLIDNNRVRNAFKSTKQAQATGALTQAQRRALLTTKPAADTEQYLTGTGPPLRVSCQCGNVEFFTPCSKPDSLWHCHCIECRKQSGSSYGTSAIYSAETILPFSSDMRQHISVYQRPSGHGGMLDCYFCKTCGSRLLHHRIDAEGIGGRTVSIKAGAIEGLDFSHARHIWTKYAVVPIPASARKSRESPSPSPPPVSHSSQAVEALARHAAGQLHAAQTSSPVAETISPIMAVQRELETPCVHPDLPSFVASASPDASYQ